MASLTALREGLAGRLAGVDGLTGYATIPATPVVPAAVVEVGTISYDSTMARGCDDFSFVLRLLVSPSVDGVGQAQMDSFLAGSGAASVKEAIEADPTLGGVAHFARVEGVRAFGLVEYGSTPYLSAEIVVEVTASGS